MAVIDQEGTQTIPIYGSNAVNKVKKKMYYKLNNFINNSSIWILAASLNHGNIFGVKCWKLWNYSTALPRSK